MADAPQTYRNHVRWFPPFHFFVLPVLLVNFLNAGRHLYQSPSITTIWGLVLALALMMLAVLTRVMVISVQDRVIRLEMRLRLRNCLPPDMQSKINDFTREQLVGMRFASDEEMPELARDVLTGNLKQREIKKRVKNWQADWLRA